MNGKERKRLVFAIAIIIMLAILVGLIAGKNKFFFTNKSENYYQSFSDDDVMYEDGEIYVDSQILLTAAERTPKEEIEQLTAEEDGEIVGCIAISQDYQIDFPSGKDYSELNNIVEKWESNECIENATLHYAMKTSCVGTSIDYQKDPWRADELFERVNWLEEEAVWSKKLIGGSNWWQEAISTPDVWDNVLDFDFKTTKVGVIDTQFDTTSKDLKNKFKKEPYQNPRQVDQTTQKLYDQYKKALANSTQNSLKEQIGIASHGTHVSGIIAAEANDFGIAGVSQNAELYGFSMNGEDQQKFTSLMKWKYAIAKLLNDGVKVLNISMGLDDEAVLAAQLDANDGKNSSTSDAIATVELCADIMERFLSKCLENYDFLIVKAAGNNGDDAYEENPNPNKDHPYSYRIVGTSKTHTDISVRYDFLGAINFMENTEVKNHIITVGALGFNALNRTINKENYSNIDVDVYAPGTNILSDYPSSKVDYMRGTSMAAPIVTGIASLVWGVNPQLSATQVRDIIIETKGSNSLNDEMVDALLAVLTAFNTQNNSVNKEALGGIIGYAYDSKSENIILDSNVEITNINTGENTQINVDPDGSFTAFLKSGTYIVKIEADGYIKSEQSVTINANSIQYISQSLVEDVDVLVYKDYIEEGTVDSGSYIAYIYNKYGDLVTSCGHNGFYSEYEYKNGLCVEERGYFRNGKQCSQHTYEYDDEGNRIAKTCTMDLAGATDVWFDDDFEGVNMSYAYDENRNIIRITGSDDSSNLNSFTKTFEYEDGVVRSVVFNSEYGEGQAEYTYNEDNSEAVVNGSTLYYASDNTEINWTKIFKYDENGNIIEESDENGNVIYRYTYMKLSDYLNQRLNDYYSAILCYQKFLLRYDDNLSSEEQSVACIDVDENGIPELLVLDREIEFDNTIYSYSPSEQKMVIIQKQLFGKGSSMSVFYNKEKHVVVLPHGDTGGYDYTFYQISDKKATPIKTFDTDIIDKHLATQRIAYLIDGKEVSESEFNSQFETETQGYTTVTGSLDSIWGRH